MDDPISRQAAIGALLEKGQKSRRYKLGEIWELNFDEIREALATVPSAGGQTIIDLELCEKKMREEIVWFVKKEMWFNDSGEVTSIAYIDEDDDETLVFRKDEKSWTVYLGGCKDLMPDDLSIISDMLELFNRSCVLKDGKEDTDDPEEEHNS